MKKKTITIALAAVVLILGAVGGTLAWLTDTTDAIENTFTVGNVGITLTETLSEGQQEWTGKLIPGSELTKDPTVTVNQNSEDCWVFVRVKMDKELDDVLQNLDIDVTDWTVIETDNNLDDGFNQVYGFNTALSAGQTAKLFDSVTVTGLGIDNTQLALANTKTMEITAYAIQKENMSNLQDAWTAHGLEIATP